MKKQGLITVILLLFCLILITNPTLSQETTNINIRLPGSINSINENDLLAEISSENEISYINAEIDGIEIETSFNQERGELRYKAKAQPIPTYSNTKDESKFQEKEVFLVSDEDWHNVLPLVPLAIWTQPDGNIRKYPLLIYHKENPEDATLNLKKEYFIDGNSLFTFRLYKKPVLDEKPDSNTFTYSFTLTDEQLAEPNLGKLILFFELIKPEDPREQTNIANEIKEYVKVNGNSLRYTYYSWMEDIFKLEINIPLDILKKENTLEFSDPTESYVVKRIKIYLPADIVKERIRADTREGCADISLHDSFCIQDIEYDKTTIEPNERFTITYHIKNTGAFRPVYKIDPEEHDIDLVAITSPFDLVSAKGFDIEKRVIDTDESFKLTVTAENKAKPQESFDADSTIYFLQQYPTSKLSIFDSIPEEFKKLLIAERPIGAQIPEGGIIIKSLNDYLSYWQSYKTIVYVEDDYEKALIASIYASLINSPLVIQGSIFDQDIIFNGITAICVGDVSRECDRRYTLEWLQKEYVRKTQTNKIIILNPDDLNIKRYNKFKTDRGQELQNIYTKDSLAAAILASGKHELIIPVQGNNYIEIDNLLDDKLHNLLGIEKWSDTCNAGEACSTGYNYNEYFQKYLSNTDTNYRLNNLNPELDYYLSLFIEGSCDKELDIYLNDEYAGTIPNVQHHSIKKYTFNLRQETITENSQISIRPRNTQDFCSYYAADIKLAPLMQLTRFLTIIASPDSIPMSDFRYIKGCESNIKFFELDNRVYGSLENWEYQTFPVGRITGISISDTSAYIARDLFSNDIEKNQEALLIMRGRTQTSTEEQLRRGAERFWTSEVKSEFDEIYEYYTYAGVEENLETIQSQYSSSSLVLFYDHGETLGLQGTISSNYLIENKIYLKPNTILTVACETCKYSGKPELFCVQNIRRGAMVYHGASDISYWHGEFDDILDSTIANGETIGEAFRKAKNSEYERATFGYSCLNLRGDPYFLILGDPTWRPKWW